MSTTPRTESRDYALEVIQKAQELNQLVLEYRRRNDIPKHPQDDQVLIHAETAMAYLMIRFSVFAQFYGL